MPEKRIRDKTNARLSAADRVLVEEGRERARELLHRNLTPSGILAATRTAKATARHYDCIFGRDTAVCALSMVLSGDAQLVQGARDGLTTLARHQADNGQIPKYVDIRRHESDFWYVGCVDATLWWLIALRWLERHAVQRRAIGRLAPNAARALGRPERELIHAMLRDPATRPRIGELVPDRTLLTEGPGATLFEALLQLPAAEPPASLLETLAPEPRMLLAALLDEAWGPPDVGAVVAGAVDRLESRLLERRMHELDRRLPFATAEEQMALAREKDTLSRQMAQLNPARWKALRKGRSSAG